MKDKTVRGGMTAALIILVLFVSCQMEIPRAVHIKASPTFEIPIPMGDGMETNSFIKPYVDTDTIRGKLAGAGEESDKIGIYEYKSQKAQTYLITYRLFDMDLDLNQYINGVTPDASRVPPVEITQEYADQMKQAFDLAKIGNMLDANGNLPYKYPNQPPFNGSYGWIDPLGGIPLEVDLGDMKELLSNITFKSEGVTFTLKTKSKDTAEQLAKAIRIRIPRLKIGEDADKADAWVQGTATQKDIDGDGVLENFVEFKAKDPIDSTEKLLLIPNQPASEKIKIELRLANTVAADEYKVDFGFNWHTADVRPQYGQDDGNNAFENEVPGFNLGSYLDDLGVGDTDNPIQIKFKTVSAYFLLETPTGNDWAGMDVEITGAQKDNSAFDLDAKFIRDDDPAKTGWIFDHSLELVKYDFSNITNHDKIKYKVTPPSTVEITNPDDGGTGMPEKTAITAKLAVLLPMELEFSGTAESYIGAEGSMGGNFLRVKFADLDKFLEGDSDTGSDGVMQQIEDQLEENGGELTKLELKLRNIKNDVITGLCLAIASEPGDKPDKWHIIDLENGGNKNIPVNTASLSLASLPKIRFLLPASPVTPPPNPGDPSHTGILTVKPLSDVSNNAFNVNMSVVAGISLNTKIDL